MFCVLDVFSEGAETLTVPTPTELSVSPQFLFNVAIGQATVS